MGAYYAIYIEDYVLSYLKREVDSLELSEIFFYGKRQNGGRKLIVYGAGRDKEIAAFAMYELLEELVCRLTQAGPVFMVRQADGDYKVSGFQTFYENNEAMQNYLIEWTSDADGHRKRREPDQKRIGSTASEPPASGTSVEPRGKKRAGSTMSAQLCLILVVLVAIMISSANSFDKMERLNQSAREVFFAIENQEAGQESAQADDLTKAPLSAEKQGQKKTEILVERDTETELSVEEAVRAENAAKTEEKAETESDLSQQTEEPEADTEEKQKSLSDEGAVGENASKKSGTVNESDSEEGGVTEEDSSEEALSRNITRYYEVEQGDTLYTISRKIYGDTSRVEKICEINEITDPDKIRSGQKIILP